MALGLADCELVPVPLRELLPVLEAEASTVMEAWANYWALFYL